MSVITAKFIQEADTIMERYKIEKPARECVCMLYNMIYGMESTLRGQPDPNAVIRIVIDMLFNLPNNPFWRQHSATMVHDFTGRVFDWLRGVAYVEQGMVGPSTTPPKELTGPYDSTLNYISIADYALRHGRDDKYNDDYISDTTNMLKELGAAHASVG